LEKGSFTRINFQSNNHILNIFKSNNGYALRDKYIKNIKILGIKFQNICSIIINGNLIRDWKFQKQILLIENQKIDFNERFQIKWVSC
jgi:hypothetical protein